MKPVTIVATLGPASVRLARELQAAGADAFRLNASHLEQDALVAAVASVVRDVPGVPVIVDLQGAKMRLGVFDPRSVAAGARVTFVRAEGERAGVPLPHPELFEALAAGETLSVDDDRIRLRVTSVHGDALEAEALIGGTLRPRKGVNVVEHPVLLRGLTERDRAQVGAVRSFAEVTFALSFMTDGREAAWLRECAPGCRVVGKVERREATLALDAIGAAVDEAWICRGDLGAQLGTRDLARFVHGFDPARLPIPTLIAGQVLEHLTAHAEPTRSEVCHVHDLLCRGYAGLVLSDETAIGHDPLNAVRVARALACDAAR